MVQLQIKPEFREQFVAAVTEDGLHSTRDEPGCLRFDAIQDVTDSTKFYLYEVYRDAAALEAHRQTPHFKKYAATVGEMYVTPPVRVLGNNVYPQDAAWR
jgi:autoinducer 2-degrading protein